MSIELNKHYNSIIDGLSFYIQHFSLVLSREERCPQGDSDSSDHDIAHYRKSIAALRALREVFEDIANGNLKINAHISFRERTIGETPNVEAIKDLL